MCSCVVVCVTMGVAVYLYVAVPCGCMCSCVVVCVAMGLLCRSFAYSTPPHTHILTRSRSHSLSHPPTHPPAHSTLQSCPCHPLLHLHVPSVRVEHEARGGEDEIEARHWLAGRQTQFERTGGGSHHSAPRLTSLHHTSNRQLTFSLHLSSQWSP